jgi:CheY-like chemotaxis protein
LRAVRLTLELSTRHAKVLTDVTLQPIVRERQLTGCLVVLADPPSFEELPAENEPPEERPEPVTREDLPPAPSQPVKPSRSKNTVTGLRILLVESDAEQARHIQEQIQALQHECRLVSDAQEALELYQEQPYDAVLCCEEPEGFGGIELCRKLRQDTRGSYPYFILMTPPEGRLQATRALEAGVDAFLNKPLEPVELSVRLKVARGVQSRLSRVQSPK